MYKFLAVGLRRNVLLYSLEPEEIASILKKELSSITFGTLDKTQQKIIIVNYEVFKVFNLTEFITEAEEIHYDDLKAVK